jgi:hypothetical protein
LEDLTLDLSCAFQTLDPSSVLGETQDAAYEIGAIEYTPLIKLLQEAMIIQRIPGISYTDQLISRNQQIVIETLRRLYPGLDNLTLILEGTVDYSRLWWTWPGFPASVRGQGQPLSSVAETRDFILQSMQSDRPMIVAKGALWLALCIQQCPVKLKDRLTNMPAPLEAMLDCYLRNVDKLFREESESRVSLDRLECLILRTKLDINMGRPWKAWLSTRSAVDSALLMGLHHTEMSGEKEEALWSQIWQTDRQLSLLLGFPYAVPEPYLDLAQPPVGQSAEAQVMRNLSIIAGRIGERNQSYQTDYAMTLQIEQELLRCRDGMPIEWWDPIFSSRVSLEALYAQSVCKIYYFQLLKMLHLPYMLKSSEHEAFNHSRISILGACRGMINSFDMLRESNMAALLICDLMDFQVFSAGIVLILDLLYQKHNRDTSEDVKDWDAIQGLIKRLQYLSGSMGCSVAAQAAHLLEHLFMAGHGQYMGTEDYEAEIPYFGKVRIRQNKDRRPQSESTSPSCSLPNSVETPSNWTVAKNVIEFNANYFMPYIQNSTVEFSHEELGVDWTTTFDLDRSYDWSQLFYSPSTGQTVPP